MSKHSRMALWVLGLFLVGVSASNRLAEFQTADDFMNVCINGQNHKKSPGAEPSMQNLCSPYKSSSCCTSQTTNSLLTNSTWYGFSWDHCGQLSDKCRRHFQRDLCFYECSPNVGPWLVQEDKKWRKERFMEAPLCRTACESWYYDCLNDMTCTPNWSKDFSWKNGVQTCPMDDSGYPAQCMLFRNIYKNAKDFCETVWDHSWKVVEDNEPCMRINLDNEYSVSDNAVVARQRAEKLVDNPRLNPNLNSAAWTSPSFLTTFTVFTSLAIRYFA